MDNSDTSGTQQNDHALYAERTLVKQGLDKDWEVVVATSTTLQLDIDGDTLPSNFNRLLGMLEEQVGRAVSEVSGSKSGNLHVVITMKNPMDILERIAWQAIFGSDSVREACHIGSAKRNEQNPILLFQRKVQVQKLLTEGVLGEQQ